MNFLTFVFEKNLPLQHIKFYKDISRKTTIKNNNERLRKYAHW